jgi:hypothetical protein
MRIRCDEPRTKVPFVRDHRSLHAGITRRLIESVVNVKPLDALYFKVNARQRIADYIRRIRRAAELLAASRIVAIGPKLIAPQPLAALSLFP